MRDAALRVSPNSVPVIRLKRADVLCKRAQHVQHVQSKNNHHDQKNLRAALLEHPILFYLIIKCMQSKDYDTF